MTAVEAIHAATKVTPKYHWLHDRGVIAEGMRANLVLLRRNH
jgi:adenine deaminase